MLLGFSLFLYPVGYYQTLPGQAETVLIPIIACSCHSSTATSRECDGCAANEVPAVVVVVVTAMKVASA